MFCPFLTSYLYYSITSGVVLDRFCKSLYNCLLSLLLITLK
nr:MAG TPA: hypothetical protein [Bacteriophage sp.]